MLCRHLRRANIDVAGIEEDSEPILVMDEDGVRVSDFINHAIFRYNYIDVLVVRFDGNLGDDLMFES